MGSCSGQIVSSSDYRHALDSKVLFRWVVVEQRDWFIGAVEVAAHGPNHLSTTISGAKYDHRHLRAVFSPAALSIEEHPASTTCDDHHGQCNRRRKHAYGQGQPEQVSSGRYSGQDRRHEDDYAGKCDRFIEARQTPASPVQARSGPGSNLKCSSSDSGDRPVGEGGAHRQGADNHRDQPQRRIDRDADTHGLGHKQRRKAPRGP